MSESRSCAGSITRTLKAMTAIFSGIDTDDLARVLASGTDHGGNPIEPFVDDDGGWPLRCCLGASVPGDRIAIVAWAPMPWNGPYAEVGPIVVHTDGCAGVVDATRLPTELDGRRMVLRPYGHDRMIAYHRVRRVAAGDSLTAHVHELLAHEAVDFVHGRNVTGGCYAFTATATRP